MTVTTTENRISYAGNDVTTEFAFPYIFFHPADLVVTLSDSATFIDVVPAPVQNGAGTYDYTVSGVLTDGEYASGGTVTFNTAPPGTLTVSIVRVVPPVQLVTLIDNTKFPAATVNTEFDYLTVLAQQAIAVTQRALHIPDAESGKVTLAAPAAIRGGKVLAWDSAGNLTHSNQTLGEIENPTAIIVSGTGYVANLAALKALAAGSQPPFLEMLGYETAGDGGGGIFVRRAGSALVANDVTVVTCTATPADRYVRQHDGLINARWAGAKMDGVTDDTAAINNAIAAAPQGGGVFLPVGTCRTTAPIVINASSGLRLTGAAAHATTILTTVAAGHVITMSNASSASVEMLRIVSSVVKSNNTAAIYAENNHNCSVRHVVIGTGSTDHNFYTGIQVEAGAGQFVFKIHDFEINGGRYGIIVGANPPGFTNDRVQDVWAIDGNITGCTEDGMLLINTTGFFFTRVDIIGCRNGLRTLPGVSGPQVSAGFMHSVICDSNQEYGFKIVTDGGYINGISFMQCWACGNGTTLAHNGILIDAGTGNIGVLRFNSMIVEANGGSGIRLTKCVDVQIADSIVACNSQASNNNKSGIEAEAGASEWQVLGGSCNGYGISSTNKQAFAIFIWPGSTFYVIDGVNVGNNLSGAIADNAGHFARRIVNNLGFTNKNYGTGVISAATSVTIAHGLNVAPDKPEIDIRPSQDPGSGIRYWVSATDGMNFTLSTSAAASFAFGWSVATMGA